MKWLSLSIRWTVELSVLNTIKKYTFDIVSSISASPRDARRGSVAGTAASATSADTSR